MYEEVRRYSGTSLGMRPANKRRRYNATTSLIGWVHTKTGYLNQMLAFDAIRISKTPYVSPVVLIRKFEGNIRFWKVLLLNNEICIFVTMHMKYDSHVLSSEGIATDPDKN